MSLRSYKLRKCDMMAAFFVGKIIFPQYILFLEEWEQHETESIV